tara:strand:+ start:2309 stop:2983 length:675 start_codon:yes stop_codon:yes gene_type:complete
MNYKNFLNSRSVWLAVSAALFLLVLVPFTAVGQETKVSLPDNPSKEVEFVGSLAKNALAAIDDESLTRIQKRDKLQALLEENFALRSIAKFSLGRYWRVLKENQKQQYFDMFERYVANVYTKRFENYSGEAFDITGTAPSNNDDVVVTSLIKPKNSAPINVKWRVRSQNDKTKVVDVIVEEVSMSVSTRSEFSSIIQRGGGTSVEPLLKYLDRDLEEVKAEEAQ